MWYYHICCWANHQACIASYAVQSLWAVFYSALIKKVLPVRAFLQSKLNRIHLARWRTLITLFISSIFIRFVTDSFSLMGTVFGVLGSICLSLYSIYTKKTLPKLNDKVLLLNYYANVYACILFIPLMMCNGEFGQIRRYEHLFELWFWFALAIGGVCGFSIGFVTALQIKVTSPLTHNISGTAKACAQTIIATHWNQEHRSTLWWLSNFVVLFGSSLYARVKQLEMDKKFNQQLLQYQKTWTIKGSWNESTPRTTTMNRIQ